MLIEGEKSPLESQPKSHTMMSAVCDGAPASLKNIKRYIRGTCIFRGKNVTRQMHSNHCTVRGGTCGGWLILRVLDGMYVKEDDLVRPCCQRGD